VICQIFNIWLLPPSRMICSESLFFAPAWFRSYRREIDRKTFGGSWVPRTPPYQTGHKRSAGRIAK